MKLFILKLLSLVVLCLGALSLAFYLGFAPVTDYIAQLPAQLTQWQQELPENMAWAKGLLEVRILWLIGSIIAFVFGAYGLFPRISKWKKSKRISYDGPHGLVQIELDTVEQSLNRVLVRMPEVKKIDVHVEPRDGGRSALIKADAVLQHQPGQNARAIAGLVSDYIAETATKMLGLEELATIELNVKAINVNTRKSSKEIRKESLSHSGNAPVELLEAAPKPMALSAPGQPLGSGPIEEEMEEEVGGDTAMEASAVDSAEEDSRQAAARSELLEPLSLHGSGEEEGEEAPSEATEEDEERDGEVPDVVEKTVEGSAANASVIPEPLGDLSDDGEDDVASDEDDTEYEEEGGVEVPDEAQTASLYGAEYESSDPTDGLPAAEEAAEELVVEESSLAEDVQEAEEAIPEVEEEAPAPNSPWAPLESDNTPAEDTAADADTAEDDAETEGDGEAQDEAPDDSVEESSDSVFGEMDTEVVSDDATTDVTDETTAAGEEEKEGEKKSWGWFN